MLSSVSENGAGGDDGEREDSEGRRFNARVGVGVAAADAKETVAASLHVVFH
jgi:hypothetical protein